MEDAVLWACLDHLRQAERLLETEKDIASLARLSLAIDMLRRAHGLADRPLRWATTASLRTQKPDHSG